MSLSHVLEEKTLLARWDINASKDYTPSHDSDENPTGEKKKAQNYATSAALCAKGSGLTNSTTLVLSTYPTIWNDIVGLDAQRETFDAAGDTTSAALCKQQIDYLIMVMCDEETEKLVRDALEQDPVPNIFDEESIQVYFDEANAYLAAAEEAITAGNADNLKSDAFAFVNVLYSIVLFLMAFIGLNKSESVRRILLGAGTIVFVIATAYMLFLPLPTGFDFWNYINLAAA